MSKNISRREFVESAATFGILGAIMCGSGYYLWKESANIESAQAETNQLIQTFVDPPDMSEIVESVDENMFRRIDYDSLKATNSDFSRWLYVPNTAIDDAVMQEPVVDQYFYNLRGFYKQYNGCGQYLIPARHDTETVDAHTLIMGHRMNSYNGEWQFSNLPTRWGDAEGAMEFPYVYLYYQDRSERYRVYAGCDLQSYDSAYKIPWKIGTDEYQGMLDDTFSKARYTLGDAPTKNDQTLFMTTCNYDYTNTHRRFVLVSVLDAEYYYDTDTFVNVGENKRYEKWKASYETPKASTDDSASASDEKSDDTGSAENSSEQTE